MISTAIVLEEMIRKNGMKGGDRVQVSMLLTGWPCCERSTTILQLFAEVNALFLANSTRKNIDNNSI